VKKSLSEPWSSDGEKTLISKKVLQELLDELKKLRSINAAKRELNFKSDASAEENEYFYTRQLKSNYPERRPANSYQDSSIYDKK
jgi:hypothetical protein